MDNNNTQGLRYFAILAVLLCAFPTLAISAPKRPNSAYDYVLPPNSKPEPAHVHFFPDLLKLSLEKTPELGEFSISFNQGTPMTTGRTIREVRDTISSVNIFWTMTTENLEDTFYTIKIPLIKGTNGYRIFLINEGDQERFDKINSAKELKALIAGLAKHWPDTEILRKNGFPVISSTNYDQLIPMLRRGRFDYFPRGAYEVFGEAQLYDGIEIEKTLALAYDAPIYFYMNHKHRQLAKRVETGLRRAIEDGSFDTLFFSIPEFSSAINEIQNSKRTVIKLNTE